MTKEKPARHYVLRTFGATLLTCLLAFWAPSLVVALDRPPNVLWARSGGGPKLLSGGYDDQANTVTGDGHGGVYISGIFHDYARFGSLEMTSTDTYEQFFLVKYDASGTPVWERHGTSSQAALGNDVKATPDGGVVVAGSFSQTSIIDGVTVAPSGPYDTPWGPVSLDRGIFAAKYDSNGNRLWIHFVKALGSGSRIAIGNAGNVFMLGQYGYGVVDCEGQVFNATNSGGSFVVKYNAFGQWQWTRATGDI